MFPIEKEQLPQLLNDWGKRIRDWDANSKMGALVGVIQHDERVEALKDHILKMGYEFEIGNSGYLGLTTFTVRRLPFQKRAETVTKISQELFDGDVDFRGYILGDAKLQMVKAGHQPVFHYYTFRQYGDFSGLIDLITTNYVPKAIWVTAPADEIMEAIEWVKTNNAHLRFAEETPVVGYNGDDFIYGVKTAQLHFTLKEPA